MKKSSYYLDKEGNFVVENYNFSKPFANFFPGIAGKYGIPMWSFYVNRAQCISSFGTKDKDHSIVEFFPANKAWQLVPFSGFRTFIKIGTGNKPLYYEPFANGFVNLKFKLQNRILISSTGLAIEEENLSLALKTRVEYFNIPSDSYAGLARILTLENTGRANRKIEIIDGLPQIVPFGTSNLFLKKLGRTIEAWMQVENLKKGVPFYRLSQDPTDRPEVIHIRGGNFYLGFHVDNKKTKIITPIVNPEYIFGQNTDLSFASRFFAAKKLTIPRRQIITSRTPCGFIHFSGTLKRSQKKELFSIVGNMRDISILNSSIARISSPEYFSRKKEENKKIIAQLQEDIATNSSSREFDLYTNQTYLDNILRGGYPVTFNGEKTFYLYSRKHGDLERDYNKFHLQPAYFSQGNGNYRDMNQNRRSDIWFHTEIKDSTLIEFLSLIQTDGFNPLVIKGVSFLAGDLQKLKGALKGITSEENIAKITSYLDKPFTPGDLILFIEDAGISLKVDYDKFLSLVIGHCAKIQEAEHGEGFWTDHWHYNLDLIESFLGVYPEKEKEIFFEKKVFTFYDNTETVRPRCEKYILYNGKPRQLHCISPDSAKREMIRKRTEEPHMVRANYGKGQIYKTTLLNKLLCLLTNKLSSLDPFGVGVEMEADKPNWFDALNGLPALFGSSTCETFELKRLCLVLIKAVRGSCLPSFKVTQEIEDFLLGLDTLIKDYLENDSSDKDYIFWDKTHALKEEYRKKTRFGFDGNETEIESGKLIAIIERALAKISQGLKKAKQGGLYYSYFINEVTQYGVLKDIFIKPEVFKQIKVPFFLEAQMHALRIAKNNGMANEIYTATKTSKLYDKQLKMYKVTAPLGGAPEEIGRCRAFTPGWLENESVWLHMEYKYLLEVLKQGLYKEFYGDFKNCLVPFQNPGRYGRSILENSSFLVSSAFPDKSLHGNGFVARLSGSTAEFLSIWLTMNTGNTPFFLNKDGELNLRFTPALPGWLFTKDGTYSFNFLSNIKVSYYNRKRKDTFGKNSVAIKKIVLSGRNINPVQINSDTIPSPYAQQVRSLQVSKIDLYLD
ncbi:MAG: cellobiose phosphorylase [Candidatus Omnitrophota bacterium]